MTRNTHTPESNAYYRGAPMLLTGRGASHVKAKFDGGAGGATLSLIPRASLLFTHIGLAAAGVFVAGA